MLDTNFYVKLIESDHCVMHKANEIFNLLHDSFEQSFLLLSMCSVAFATFWLLHVLLVIFEELHSSGDGSLSFLKKFLQDISEELDQLDKRVVSHILQMLTDGIELSLVFDCRCINDAKSHYVMLEVLFCHFSFCCHVISRELTRLELLLVSYLKLQIHMLLHITFTD